MNSLIFRTMAPLFTAVMLVFAIYICLRGHNEPGGGFIGGLIAAAAIAVFGMAAGAKPVRSAMRLDPLAYAGCGLLLAGLSGVPSLFVGSPFLTGIWPEWAIGGAKLPISTPLLFDVGVFLVVFGMLSSVLLALQHDSGEGT